MLKALTRRRKAQAQARPDPDWPHIEILFLDESEDERDEANTLMRVPMVPRAGETVMLDGDFRRRGTFVVERVEYTFCCDRREVGWVRDLGVYISLFVREN